MANKRRPRFITIERAVLRWFAHVYKLAEPERPSPARRGAKRISRTRRRKGSSTDGQKSMITSAFYTYVALASFRNYAQASEHFGTAFPSVPTLAGLTGQSERTVTINLQRLERWGLIVRESLKESLGRTRKTWFVDDPNAFIIQAQKEGRTAAIERIIGGLAVEIDDARVEVAKEAGVQLASGVGVKRASPGGAAGFTPPPQPASVTPVTGYTRSAVEVDLREVEKRNTASADAAVRAPSLTPEGQNGNSNGQGPPKETAQRPSRPCVCHETVEDHLAHGQAQAALMKQEAVH